MTATQTALETEDKLTEILAPFSDRLHGLDVEASFEDSNEWPIPSWKVEDYEESEISRSFVMVRIFADGYDCDQCVADIISAAKESGIELTECRNARHRDGAQINLQTRNF